MIKIQSKIFKILKIQIKKIKKLKNEISNIILTNFNTPIWIIALKGTYFFKCIKQTKIFNCVTVLMFKFKF